MPNGSVQLALRDDSGAPVPAIESSDASSLRPARLLLQEWTDYWVEQTEAAAVHCGTRALIQVAPGVFQLRFENQLGRATLQARGADGAAIGPPLHVEVVSRKFATVESYVAFSQVLLDDLFALSSRLPFAVDAPVGRSIGESWRPPTPFMAMHFLLAHGEALISAARMVLRRPHERQDRGETRVELGRASEADADVLLDVLRAPGHWLVVPKGRLALADRLGGHAPSEVWQPLVLESLDTPENRFVRAFLEQVLRTAERLPREGWWTALASARQERVTDITNQLRRILGHPLLRTVGPLRQLPASSRVLMRREGYRELYGLWRSFQLGRRPLFRSLSEAADLRDMATLYEVWAYFSLCQHIGRALDQAPVMRLRIDQRAGLRRAATAHFPDRGKLVYDRPVSGYSTPLRPDYLWLGQDGTRVALDAKFRLGNQEPIGAPADLAVDDWLEEAVDDHGARYPAIGTMHHYRDALGLAAAVVVYPGTRARFYPVDGQPAPPPSLAELLSGRRQGVGAYGLMPGALPTFLVRDEGDRT